MARAACSTRSMWVLEGSFREHWTGTRLKWQVKARQLTAAGGWAGKGTRGLSFKRWLAERAGEEAGERRGSWHR